MPNEQELNEALKTKFLSKDSFAEGVEQLAKDFCMNYIDAIVEFCSVHSIEVESVSKLMSKPLKDKLKADAIELNYLKEKKGSELNF